MPLFKRKPYVLRKPPKDLLPDEDVFQVRFTKEVFRDYTEYLNCMKFYRRRVWTCKVSGKTNLTYEEALVSERKATEKVQSFPKEFMGPVLHMVQLSPLRIDELVDRVYKVFKERYVPGEEVTGVRDEMLGSCRILKVFEQDEDESPLYEIAWLDEDGKKMGAAETVLAESLRRKKLPFSRALLKAFIRETASSGPSRNSAWVVLDKLARKYKIPIQAPERSKGTGTAERDSRRSSSGKKVEVRVEVGEVQNGVQVVRKRKRSEASGIRKKSDGKRQQVDRVIPQPIRYPIEDTHVKPSASDPPLSDRPVAATDFVVPVECTGDMLMVWDFCCLFGKALLLSPFGLEDFEKSLDYKEGEAPLLLEMTHSLLRAALTDAVLKDEFQHKRKKRTEVSMTNWKDDLCDFLELPSQTGVTSNVISMIRQGYYKGVTILDRVNILRTLVSNCLNSTIIRNQIDDNIGDLQSIVTQKRELEAEVVRRRKEERELMKQQRSGQANGRVIKDGEQGGDSLENGERDDGDDEDLDDSPSINEDIHPTGWTVKGRRNSFGSHSPVNNGISGKQEEIEPVSVSRSRKELLRKKVEKKLAEEQERERQRTEEQKKLQEKRKEQAEALAERKMQEQKVYERQRKHEQLERETEKLIVLTTPLGKDRFHNRFWFFNREGRVFVESDDSSRWGFYAAKEEVDALIGSLNVKGIRERALHNQLEIYQGKICNALQKRSKELAQRYSVEEASVRRSERVRTAPRLTGFLAYVNKYRASS